MEIFLAGAITAIVSYLLGSLNFAIIFSRIFKKEDIRSYGSDNAGMTNILRTYGLSLAIPTLIGDFAKGAAAVMLGRWVFDMFEVTTVSGQYVAGLFALLGHVFPVFFKFKGGKGAMTSLGIMLMISPKIFMVVIIVAALIILTTGYVSLASISGAIVYPILTYIMSAGNGASPLMDTVFALFFSVIVIGMHNENIQRLINGTERKISIGHRKGNSAAKQEPPENNDEKAEK